jgi:hypothetical protein
MTADERVVTAGRSGLTATVAPVVDAAPAEATGTASGGEAGVCATAVQATNAAARKRTRRIRIMETKLRLRR